MPFTFPSNAFFECIVDRCNERSNYEDRMDYPARYLPDAYDYLLYMHTVPCPEKLPQVVREFSNKLDDIYFKHLLPYDDITGLMDESRQNNIRYRPHCRAEDECLYNVRDYRSNNAILFCMSNCLFVRPVPIGGRLFEECGFVENSNDYEYSTSCRVDMNCVGFLVSTRGSYGIAMDKICFPEKGMNCYACSSFCKLISCCLSPTCRYSKFPVLTSADQRVVSTVRPNWSSVEYNLTTLSRCVWCDYGLLHEREECNRINLVSEICRNCKSNERAYSRELQRSSNEGVLRVVRPLKSIILSSMFM